MTMFQVRPLQIMASRDSLRDPLRDVYVRRNLQCSDTCSCSTYYSSNIFEDCCAHCGFVKSLQHNVETYPTCVLCYDTPIVWKRKRRCGDGKADNNTDGITTGSKRNQPLPVITAFW